MAKVTQAGEMVEPPVRSFVPHTAPPPPPRMGAADILKGESQSP